MTILCNSYDKTQEQIMSLMLYNLEQCQWMGPMCDERIELIKSGLQV